MKKRGLPTFHFAVFLRFSQLFMGQIKLCKVQKCSLECYKENPLWFFQFGLVNLEILTILWVKTRFFWAKTSFFELGKKRTPLEVTGCWIHNLYPKIQWLKINRCPRVFPIFTTFLSSLTGLSRETPTYLLSRPICYTS